MVLAELAVLAVVAPDAGSVDAYYNSAASVLRLSVRHVVASHSSCWTVGATGAAGTADSMVCSCSTITFFHCVLRLLLVLLLARFVLVPVLLLLDMFCC